MGLGCYGCHRLGDQGYDIGPDLSEQGEKLNRDWLFRWLKKPEATMPDSKMGDFHLTDEEARALADYLMTHRSPSAFEDAVERKEGPSAS
jgi:mono/diheme cytochrome c family protein